MDHFVTSAIFKPPGESLMRWNTPICPLVQGLPAEFNSFIQEHISQIARSAHALLAAPHCAANLYVFATDHPDRLLKKLLAHNPRMYSMRNGAGAVQRFLHSRRPVRVWYNTALECRSRSSPSASMEMVGAPSGSGAGQMGSNTVDVTGPQYCSGGGTRLGYSAVNSILAAFIVVDMQRMKKITTRELADYLSVVGLADVRLDAHADALPTILRLFQHPKRAPRRLSPWDRALLYSLYNTKQSSTLQVADVETSVMNRIKRHGSPARGPSRARSAIPRWANEVLPQRAATAIYWYRIAADKNSPAAQYELAVKYVLGEGVPQSYAEAAHWYRKAAEQGYIDAQYNLAVMYSKGQGVPRSYPDAARWYRAAAEQGYIDAQFNLGFMYAIGQGLPQSYVKAARWYRKAAQQGNIGAQHNLAVMYLRGEGVPRNNTKAAEWYRKAAKQGDADAQTSLGLAYAKGQGIPRDYAKAAEWFHQAADQGDADAQFDLGVMYANGHGVPRDPVSAFEWWILAKADSSFGDNAYDWSRNRMKRSASRMSADQIARARRAASKWLAAHHY